MVLILDIAQAAPLISQIFWVNGYNP